MNKEYTKKQLVESMVKWSIYMLEKGMITESEAKELLGEGLFKRAMGAIKRGVNKVKDTYTKTKEATKQALHDMFKPNEGVKKMLVAMQSIVKDGKVKLDGVKIFATLGDKVLPVKEFAMKGKRALLLLVDRDDASAKPKTLDELRNYLHDVLGKAKVKDAIQGIYCAEAPKAMLAESKLTDYLADKKLSKEDALKPETLKELKKLTKQNDEKTKAAVEKYFASKDDDKPADTKKKPASKKSSKKSGEDDKETKSSEESGAPEEKKEETKPEEEKKEDTKEEPKAEKKDTLKMFDNKLLDVKAEKGNLGFVFSKAKAEIALDKSFADQFEI